MEDLYIEQPFILNLEKTLADKSFFVSEESLKMNMDRNGSIFRRPSVLYNFSPDSFIDDFISPDSPKKIGIVSCFQNYGAGDIIELDNGDMVSFVGATVDMNTKTIYTR